MTPEDILHLVTSDQDSVRDQGYRLVDERYSGKALPRELADALLRQFRKGSPWNNHLVLALFDCASANLRDLILVVLRHGSAFQKQAALASVWLQPLPERWRVAFDAAHDAANAGETWAPKRLAQIIVESSGTEAAIYCYADEMLSLAVKGQVDDELRAIGTPTIVSTIAAGVSLPRWVDVRLRRVPLGGLRALLAIRSAFGAAVSLADLRAFKNGDPPLVVAAGEEPWARSILLALPSELQSVLEFETMLKPTQRGKS